MRSVTEYKSPQFAVSARTVVEDGVSLARRLASSVQSEYRLSLARSVGLAVVRSYWRALATHVQHLPLRRVGWEIKTDPVAEEAGKQLATIGTAAAALDPVEAGYRIGTLYTAMMPKKLRSELGAYYTPPTLCEQLLDMADDAGTDWATARVLDPACGGGAFLAPVARRMAASLKDWNAVSVL